MNLSQLSEPPQRLLSEEELASAIRRQLGAGMGAAAIYLEESLRRTLSVPAPLRVIPGGQGRRGPYARAATPATSGAPPRLVTGRLRGGVFSRQVDELMAEFGVEGVPYAAKQEDVLNHMFVEPTVRREMESLNLVVGRAVQAERAV
jgi:hypothetical protein